MTKTTETDADYDEPDTATYTNGSWDTSSQAERDRWADLRDIYADRSDQDKEPTREKAREWESRDAEHEAEWEAERAAMEEADLAESQAYWEDQDALEAEQSQDEKDWRRATAIEYDEHLIGYSNMNSNHSPDEDLHLDAERAAERDAIYERLAAEKGVSAGTLRAEARDAATAHGNDPGSDAEPDRFAPPDYEALREREQRWAAEDAAAAKREASSDPWSSSPDQQDDQDEA